MYSTVPACHIALDAKLQLLNSNRKIAIHPEQYDMALNEAILQLITQKSHPKLNSKQEGFEQSIKRYDDLQNLKKTVSFIPFNNGSNYYMNLPSDYLSYNSMVGSILYNKNGIGKTEYYKQLYYTICDFTSVQSITNATFSFGNGTIVNASTFATLSKSNKSRFYFYNIVSDYIKTKYNIDSYYEYYNDKYYPNSLIFVTDDPAKRIMSSNIANLVLTPMFENLKVLNSGFNIQYIRKYIKFDLVSSITRNTTNTDYYLHNNNHLNPQFTISGNKLEIRNDNRFNIENLELEYIKKPRLINSTIGQMTDFKVTDEVINAAVTNLSLIIKDETYNVLSQKEQLNN